MKDMPFQLEARQMHVHAVGKNKQAKFNMPAGWFRKIGKDDFPGLLIHDVEHGGVVVLNVEVDQVGLWCRDVATSLVQRGESWASNHAGAFRRRLEIALDAVPAPVRLDSLSLSIKDNKARALAIPPVDQQRRSVLDEMCKRLGLWWSMPCDEPGPVIEFTPAGRDEHVFRYSREEEMRVHVASKVLVGVTIEPAARAAIPAIFRAFQDDFDRFERAVIEASKQTGIQAHFSGSRVRFSWNGSDPAPFTQFKLARLDVIPAESFAVMEAAFKAATGAHELDVLACIAVDRFVDGVAIKQVRVAASELKAASKGRVLVPMVPSSSKTAGWEALVAEVVKLASTQVPDLAWIKGYPPPMYPDRLGDVPLLHCPCGANISLDVYTDRGMLAEIKCKACHARLPLTFEGGEYTISTKP